MNAYLHDCGLQLVGKGYAGGEEWLREFADQGYQVAHPVSADCRCWNEGDEFFHIFIFIK